MSHLARASFDPALDRARWTGAGAGVRAAQRVPLLAGDGVPAEKINEL
jgi:hypothetical protein